MTTARNTKLAALTAALLLPAGLAGCNAHPLKEVEYQTGGGIDLDTDGDDGEDAGDDEGDSDDEGDGDGDGDDGGDDVPNADDGADDGDDGGEPLCTTDTIDVAANPPKVMLVLDKSYSMVDESWDVDGQDVRRWESLHGVVSGLVEVYDESMDFGTVLFPALGATNNGGSGCVVADTANVAPASGNGQAIIEAIPGATEFDAIRGYTPARRGVQLATETLGASNGQGGKAIILVTDGLANCNGDNSSAGLYDQEMPSALEAAAAQQIPTYVVGIDIRDEHVSYADANAAEELDTVARAGGVPANTSQDAPAYYDARDEDALYDALDEIAARVECTVPLNQPAPADATVTIAIDGEEIGEVQECSDGSGWRFADPAVRGSIELCGSACDALRVTGEVQTTACDPGETVDPTLPIP